MHAREAAVLATFCGDCPSNLQSWPFRAFACFSSFAVFDFVAATPSFARNPGSGTFAKNRPASAFVLRVGRNQKFCFWDVLRCLLFCCCAVDFVASTLSYARNPSFAHSRLFPRLCLRSEDASITNFVVGHAAPSASNGLAGVAWKRLVGLGGLVTCKLYTAFVSMRQVRPFILRDTSRFSDYNHRGPRAPSKKHQKQC